MWPHMENTIYILYCPAILVHFFRLTSENNTLDKQWRETKHHPSFRMKIVPSTWQLNSHKSVTNLKQITLNEKKVHSDFVTIIHVFIIILLCNISVLLHYLYISLPQNHVFSSCFNGFSICIFKSHEAYKHRIPIP